MARLKKNKIHIGITGPEKGGLVPWIFTKYALKFADAEIYRLTPSQPHPPRPLDGLIIGGGADIDPGFYGQERLDVLSAMRDLSLIQKGLAFLRRRITREIGVGYVQIEPSRDQMEFDLLEDSFKRQIPTLGICRGAQLINVYLGGTLQQDIQSIKLDVPHIKSVLPKKRVKIEPQSNMASFLQTTECYINSLHKQAIDKLGDGLTVSARDQNGIVQAVEKACHPFLIGVQWHPEYLPQNSIQQRIFRAFIDVIRSTGESTAEG